jgi:hypothetical protein
VIQKIPALAARVERDGMVGEDYFMSILGEMPGVDNCLPKLRGKPLNSMRVSRQRALVVSHETVRKGEADKRAQIERGEADPEDFIQEDVVRVHGEEEENEQYPDHDANDGTQAKKKAKKARAKKCTFYALCGQSNTNPAFFSTCKSGDKKCKLLFCMKEECVFRYEQHLAKCVKH